MTLPKSIDACGMRAWSAIRSKWTSSGPTPPRCSDSRIPSPGMMSSATPPRLCSGPLGALARVAAVDSTFTKARSGRLHNHRARPSARHSPHRRRRRFRGHARYRDRPARRHNQRQRDSPAVATPTGRPAAGLARNLPRRRHYEPCGFLHSRPVASIKLEVNRRGS